MNTVEVLGCVWGVSIGSNLDPHTSPLQNLHCNLRCILSCILQMTAQIWGGGGRICVDQRACPT